LLQQEHRRALVPTLLLPLRTSDERLDRIVIDGWLSTYVLNCPVVRLRTPSTHAAAQGMRRASALELA
jgi:hypothetical protein